MNKRNRHKYIERFRICIFWYLVFDCFFYFRSTKNIFTINFKEGNITSVAFYIIATIKQKFNPDLRGNFWELLLPKAPFSYSLNYLSDGNFIVNGVKFKVYGNYTLNSNGTLEDDRECKRVSASWEDFVQNNIDKKWFFKGGHDTYVNVPEFLKLIKELERKGDPMKKYNFAYILHVYNNKIAYPQGGA